MYECLNKNNINVESYEEYNFDDVKCDLEFLFSRPNGLRESIEARIKTIHNELNVPHNCIDYNRLT